MASIALCDGVMECDSAVCISEGQGDVLTRITSDGNVQFEFPEKPAHVKILPHEMCLTPWRCQGEKGTVTETAVVEAADGPKQMYDGYLRGHIEKLLHGENLVCTSFGEAKTRKMGLIFGDDKSKHGALYYFFEELFAAEVWHTDSAAVTKKGTHGNNNNPTAHGPAPRHDVGVLVLSQHRGGHRPDRHT